MPTPNSQPKPNFDFADPINRQPPIPEAFKAPPPQNLATPPTQSATRIFPQLINQPRVQTELPTAVNKIKTGGRIAGNFKMPPFAGVAGRGAARVGGRFVPVLGTLLLAHDAYQLGCAFGLLPGTICPRSDNPAPGGSTPPFQGGQCTNTRYRVAGTAVGGGIGSTPLNVIGEYWGPISGVTSYEVAPGSWRVVVKCRGNTSDYSSPGNATEIDAFLVQAGTTPAPYPKFTLGSIYRTDGQADNCGNLPTTPVPRQSPEVINNVTQTTNNISINITIPSPLRPTPLPRVAPRIIFAPSPLPDINITFGDNYFGGGEDDPDFDIEITFNPFPRGNFTDFPDIFNNFPISPQPQTRYPNTVVRNNPNPGTSVQPAPIPQVPKPVPITLPTDRTESDEYIFRQNKEILDKLYRVNGEIDEIQTNQEKQNKILDNLQKLLDFEVEGEQLIKRCDDIEIFYTYKDKVLKAINRQLDQIKKIEQTVIDEVCNVQKENIVAIPDWWQVRLQADVPQIALIFRSSGTRTYYKLTIPHPANIDPPTTPPIDSYLKGSFQVMITCKDNSKFIANCRDINEAERVGNIALSLISPEFKTSEPRLYFAERKGEPIAETTMRATSALYYATGQQNLAPTWRKSFSAL